MWSTTRIREFDNNGVQQNCAHLRDKGFQKGMRVQRRSDKVEAVIVELGTAKVSLRLDDGSRVSSSSESFLKGEWKEAAKVVAPEFLETSNDPRTTEEWVYDKRHVSLNVLFKDSPILYILSMIVAGVKWEELQQAKKQYVLI